MRWEITGKSNKASLQEAYLALFQQLLKPVTIIK
jgi:hypothetical protein